MWTCETPDNAHSFMPSSCHPYLNPTVRIYFIFNYTATTFARALCFFFFHLPELRIPKDQTDAITTRST
jgi:hypothetical protein